MIDPYRCGFRLPSKAAFLASHPRSRLAKEGGKSGPPAHQRVIWGLDALRLGALQGQVHVDSGAERQVRSWILCIRRHSFRSTAEEYVCGPDLLWARCENRSTAHDDWAGSALLTAPRSGRNSHLARLRPREPLSNQSR